MKMTSERKVLVGQFGGGTRPYNQVKAKKIIFDRWKNAGA
jgi:hypothetical protein